MTKLLSDIAVRRIGVVDYQAAWELQQQFHAARVEDREPDTLLLLEHPSVYTAGKRTTPDEYPSNGAPVIPVDRGGKITWHGPGQLVGYPILKLPDPVDVVAYVRRVEEVLIAACSGQGLATNRVKDRSGVWVLGNSESHDTSSKIDRKVAAIGIRVSRGVTMHGFALNCDPDLSFFEAIVPCGIPDAGVTSLTIECGRRVTVDEMADDIERRVGDLTRLP